MRTYFHDFKRDDGLPVTVEYGVDGSHSPTTYSPMSGADGGDEPEFCIVDSWPNDAAFNDLARRRNDRAWKKNPSLIDRAAQWFLEVRLTLATLRRGTLTSNERERMEAWLAEHYVDESSEEDF